MEDDDKVKFHSFLRYYDLDPYYERFVKMGVLKLSHLKDVSDADLNAIGLSGPERTRLRKKAEQTLSKSGKLKNKIWGKDKRKFASLGKQEAVVAAALAARERDRGHQLPSPSPPPRPRVQGGEGLESPILISPESIELGEMLGEGAHGAVHEAKYHNVHGSVKVAVKTIITRDRGTSIEAVVKEAQSMMQLHHTHIIKFYGIILESPLMLVQELAPFGNLRDHLLSNPQRVHLGLMYTYACQIADAMSYLEERKLVHRDLATRNILLLTEGQIKLSDFGLARKIREGCSVYSISDVGVLLPIAWTGLEALIHGQFSSASDVWSYGVTLWEIYSLGETPLEGMRPIEVREMLQSGDRLRRPMRCPPQVYGVMQECWLEHPEQRPTFKNLHKIVKELLPEVVQTLKPQATEGELYLSSGELVYVIDKPAAGSGPWLGVAPDGTLGYFKSEFVRPVDPEEFHALSPITSVPLRKRVYNKYQFNHPTSSKATGSSQKPAEVTGGKAASGGLNHIGRYDFVKKDLIDFTGVEEQPDAFRPSPPNSPVADDNKYVTMKKMKELEVNGGGEWGGEYLMMQPSPVRLSKPFPGQIVEGERQFAFQPSVDESQLPEPIIPSQEMLHNVLYASSSTANARPDFGGFDPLLCPSSPMDSSPERSSYKPRPLPGEWKGHYAGYPAEAFDGSSGQIGLQMGQEWEPLPPQPVRRISPNSAASPSSSERYVGQSPEHSRIAQPSTQQHLLTPQENVAPSGTAGTGYGEQLATLSWEFPDLNAWTCRVALEKHGGNLDMAREEVKVTQLMGMGFAYIDEDDCRRALSHCQGKMERAAMWLMEKSEVIASRT